MRFKLAELQKLNKEGQEIRAATELQKSCNRYEEIDRMLDYQGLFFIPEIMRIELISKKYSWPSLLKDVEVYIKCCDVFSALKTIKHKFYGDL